MSVTNYENLRIYQLAEDLADGIWNLVITWDYFAKDTLGKQLVRAADSVCANIAEGNGRGSDIDYRKFLRQARGSLYETKSFLKRAEKRNLLGEQQKQFFEQLQNELTLKLNAYLRSLTNTINSKKQISQP